MLLKGKKATDDKLVALTNVSRVKNLEIIDASITDAGISQLAKASRLRSLLIWDSPSITCEALSTLCSINTLEELHLEYLSKMRFDDLQTLPKLPALSGLRLSGFKLDSRVLQWIASCDSLHFVGLCNCSINDEMLKHLSALKCLINLDLTGNDITGIGFQQLFNTNLVNLYLRNCPVSDTGITSICQSVGRLHILDLSRTRISDAAMTIIAALENLGDLKISFTAITDNGLVRLHGHSSLVSLEVEGTTISENGLAQLIQASPKPISIYRKSYVETLPGPKNFQVDCRVREL